MPSRPCRRRASGFSLVEVLIAAAIFLLIAIGVIPLFTRSIQSNLAGNDATLETSNAAEQVEDLSQVRFNSAETTWAGAATVDTSAWQYRILGSTEWLSSVPSGETQQFGRRLLRRQYQIQTDGVATLVSGDATPGQVHIKEMEVQIVNFRLPKLDGSPNYVVRLRKAI